MRLVQAGGQVDGAKHRSNIRLLENTTSQWASYSDFTANSGLTYDSSDIYTPIASTLTNSRMVVVRDNVNLQLLVVASGMDMDSSHTNINPGQQIPAIIDGWMHNDGVNDGPLQPYATAARSAFAFCSLPDPSQSWRQITLVGFSFGGATCVQLMRQLRDAYPNCGIECWTYGSPKNMNRRQPQLTGEYIVETRITGDPVPAIPPRYQDSLVMILASPAFPRQLGNDVIHPVTPYYVAEDGTMTASRDESPNPSTGNILSVEAWLIGSNVWGAGAHQLSTYKSYLANTPAVGNHNADGSGGGGDWGRAGGALFEGGGDANQNFAEGGGDANVGSGAVAQRPTATPLPRLSVAARRRAEREALAEQGVQTVANVQATMNSFKSDVTWVPGDAFASRTIRGVRTVTYGGNVMWVVSGKRVQRKLVRDMNDYLRSVGAI